MRGAGHIFGMIATQARRRSIVFQTAVVIMLLWAAMFLRTSRIAAAAIGVLIVCAQPGSAAAQGAEDPYMRIERLEQQLRTLTGQNEELQYRNRMLEQQLQQVQGGAAAVAPPPAGSAGALPPVAAPPAAAGQGYPPPARDTYPAPQVAPPLDLTEPSPARGGRRGDAFDPAANPSAPGVPRPLGSTPPTPPPADVGAPGGRNAGEPLNLSTALPGGAAGGLATAPPSGTPRDEFDLGIGYIQRKDYALAEETMRNFTKRHPSDALVGDAQYWLGESLYQRQRYRDAAEAFLAVTTKYDRSGKAPDALLRLGQSLAALKEKEAACAALGEVTRKYPKASSGVKNGVTREQKRIGC